MTAGSGIAAALERQPRFPLARLPTPLHELPHLRAALGGEARCPRILIKRDDLTDLAPGGNKARKLEYIVAAARREGATALVTTGAVQSNHARMTAAAARRAGMRAVLVLNADRADPPVEGNLLLDHLLGADVRFVDTSGMNAAAAEAAEAAAVERALEDLRAAGETPQLVPLGGSTGLGTLGYVQCTLELVRQLEGMHASPALLYYASGSRGTQAGLELGARLFGASWTCMGIAVSGGEAEKRVKAAQIANEAAELLGSSVRLDPETLQTDQDHYGAGYAIPTPGSTEAIRLLMEAESILLDPVYTAKAMAGMIHHIRSGRIDPASTIVFLHTGGLPGLFTQAGRRALLRGIAS